MSLSKTVALVTGGSSGLGAAAVQALLKQGARVLVGDLQPPNDDTYDKYKNSLDYCHVNVTQPDTIATALDQVETRFGQPLTAVINSAGVATAMKTWHPTKGAHDAHVFERTLQVNTLGSFHVARLAAERMQHWTGETTTTADNSTCCIIQTASIAAYEGQVGQVAYAASKAAIVGMTLPMARDLAPYRIRVVTIAPGLFATPLLTGLPEKVQDELGHSVPCPNRLGYPSEYGQLVVHILENQMLNGTTIRLDGALRMPP